MSSWPSAAPCAFTCTSGLNTIEVPTLIVQGRRNRLAPVRMAAEMRARIPYATLRTFDCGHGCFITRMAPFLAAVERFLGTFDPPTP